MGGGGEGESETTLESQVSPSTTWDPDIDLLASLAGTFIIST